MRRIIIAAVLLALVLPLLAIAQSSGPTPKVLAIYREEVKPGKTMAHEKMETAWTQALQRANWQTPMLALTSMSGPDQVWFTVGFDSFAEFEKNSKAEESTAAFAQIRQQYGPTESDFLASSRSLIAVLQPELSYKTDFDLAATRYFRVRMVRVPPGHGDDWTAMRKMVVAAFTKANSDGSNIVYRVAAGAPSGTFLVFAPYKSLAEMDRQMNMREVMGADFDKLVELGNKAAASTEDTLFSINNRMTLPAKEWVAADPTFWHAKPAVAKAAPAKPAVVPAKDVTKK